MRGKYLGDSYDLVKRFWAEKLLPIAPLYAHPKFVPEPIREEYETVTSIPMLVLESVPKAPFGILLDPDTGIPLPGTPKPATVTHATLPFIVDAFERLQPKYVICFDQSYHRQHELSRERQRQTKMKFLNKCGFASFYYVSHAPFLFAAKSTVGLAEIYTRLVALGIPETRFESIGPSFP